MTPRTGKTAKKFLVGKTFGRLTILEELDPTFCLVQCGCENKTIKKIRRNCLLTGNTKSCGCLQHEFIEALNKNHGYSGHNKDRHLLYVAWSDMVQRCTNLKNSNYTTYGGRGITIYDEWRASPEAFIVWALENGWQKGLVLDRIDNDGNYCPENCRYITIAQNNRNKRDNINVEINGEKLCLKDACEKFSIFSYSKVRYRIKLGWKVLDAMLLTEKPTKILEKDRI